MKERKNEFMLDLEIAVGEMKNNRAPGHGETAVEIGCEASIELL